MIATRHKVNSRNSVEVDLHFAIGIEPEMLEAVQAGIHRLTRFLGKVCIGDVWPSNDLQAHEIGDTASFDRSELNRFTGSDLSLVVINSALWSQSDGMAVLGIAYFEPKVAVVDARTVQGSRSVEYTTAHELAHLLGLKNETSRSYDPDNPQHCRDAHCIMCYVGVNTFKEDMRRKFAAVMSKRLDESPEINEHWLSTYEMLKTNIKKVPNEPGLLDFCDVCAQELSACRLVD